MSVPCPHCSVQIDGFVSQATLESRINSKSEESRMLKEALREAKAKADGFDSVVAERDTLRGQITNLTERSSRLGALAKIGVMDEQTIRGFESIYSAEIAGIAEGERPAFSAWLEAEEGARTHPLLSKSFSGAPPVPAAGSGGDDHMASGGPAQPAAPAAPPPAYPIPNGGAPPGPPPARDQRLMNPAQVRAHLHSLSRTQRAAWRAEHGAKYGWAPEPAAPPVP